MEKIFRNGTALAGDEFGSWFFCAYSCILDGGLSICNSRKER